MESHSFTGIYSSFSESVTFDFIAKLLTLFLVVSFSNSYETVTVVSK